MFPLTLNSVLRSRRHSLLYVVTLVLVAVPICRVYSAPALCATAIFAEFNSLYRLCHGIYRATSCAALPGPEPARGKPPPPPPSQPTSQCGDRSCCCCCVAVGTCERSQRVSVSLSVPLRRAAASWRCSSRGSYLPDQSGCRSYRSSARSTYTRWRRCKRTCRLSPPSYRVSGRVCECVCACVCYVIIVPPTLTLNCFDVVFRHKNYIA